MELYSFGVPLWSIKHLNGAASAGCTENYRAPGGLHGLGHCGCWGSDPPRQNLDFHSGLSCLVAVATQLLEERCCPLDLIWCFISLVIDKLIRKRRQKFLCYGLWEGVGMREFC